MCIDLSHVLSALLFIRSKRVEIRKQPTITIETSIQDFALLEKKNDCKTVPISLMDMSGYYNCYH